MESSTSCGFPVSVIASSSSGRGDGCPGKTAQPPQLLHHTFSWMTIFHKNREISILMMKKKQQG